MYIGSCLPYDVGGITGILVFRVGIYFLQQQWASLVAQMVKTLTAMQEPWVQYLGQEDPLEEGMVTHSSILAWRIPWTEEPGGLYSPWGRKELDMAEQLSLSITIDLEKNYERTV